jgi:hypothetical protein
MEANRLFRWGWLLLACDASMPVFYGSWRAEFDCFCHRVEMSGWIFHASALQHKTHAVFPFWHFALFQLSWVSYSLRDKK